MMDVHFSHISDLYQTPDDLFAELDREFGFVLDAAADKYSAKCKFWLGPGGCVEDATLVDWYGIWKSHRGGRLERCIFFNPPYSRCAEFVERAALAAAAGVKVVGLLPARTDTRWFHHFIWNQVEHAPRGGVQVRLLKGRLKFTLRVTKRMRAAVKAAPRVPEKRLAKRLGLPVLIIRAIREKRPAAVESAPFPSMIVVFGD